MKTTMKVYFPPIKTGKKKKSKSFTIHSVSEVEKQLPGRESWEGIYREKIVRL